MSYASLFLIHVNDMVRACDGLDLVLFADDTNIFAQGGDTAELFGIHSVQELS